MFNKITVVKIYTVKFNISVIFKFFIRSKKLNRKALKVRSVRISAPNKIVNKLAGSHQNKNPR